jgi:hypothetical protein
LLDHLEHCHDKFFSTFPDLVNPGIEHITWSRNNIVRLVYGNFTMGGFFVDCPHFAQGCFGGRILTNGYRYIAQDLGNDCRSDTECTNRFFVCGCFY